MSDTKSFSIRTEKDRIELFNQACSELPLHFKSRQLIESYMDYVISIADDYKKGKPIRMGFINKKGMVIIYDSVGSQQLIDFDIEEHKETDEE